VWGGHSCPLILTLPFPLQVLLRQCQSPMALMRRSFQKALVWGTAKASLPATFPLPAVSNLERAYGAGRNLAEIDLNPWGKSADLFLYVEKILR
jgi:hypothetical protein